MPRLVSFSVLAQIGVLILSAQANKTGAVEGMVVNSVTGLGLEGAVVAIIRAPPGHQYSGVTDAKGMFRIDAIEPGDYRTVTRKDRFVSPQGIFGSGSPIHVGAGDVVPLRLELMPPGKIRGRVMRADNTPAANVEVELGGNSGADGNSKTKTGDDGTFVFENVPPGQHSLMAQGPVRTYFPAALDPAFAEEFGLAPGADQSGYEIRLQSPTVHRVRGVVVDDAGEPVRKARINLFRPVLRPETFNFVLTSEKGTVFAIRSRSVAAPAPREDLIVAGEDGSFEMPAVPEGDWGLHAEAQGMHQNLTIVLHQDIDDLKIRLEPEFAINGRVTLSDGTVAEGNPTVTVRLVSADGWPNLFGASTSGNNGLLSIGSQTSGRYRVFAEAISGRFYVDSVMAGSENATDQPVLLSPVTRDIQIIVKAGGTIRGTVDKCNGATVLVVPSSMAAGDLGRSHSCSTDGSFEFAGLPPGEYYATALAEFDPHISTDRLRELMSYAVPVHIDDGGVASAQLKVQ